MKLGWGRELFRYHPRKRKHAWHEHEGVLTPATSRDIPDDRINQGAKAGIVCYWHGKRVLDQGLIFWFRKFIYVSLSPAECFKSSESCYSPIWRNQNGAPGPSGSTTVRALQWPLHQMYNLTCLILTIPAASVERSFSEAHQNLLKEHNWAGPTVRLGLNFHPEWIAYD